MFPLRRDQPHSLHALGGTQQINAAGKIPAALADSFQVLPTLQPAFANARGGVAAEERAFGFEAEQLQPVLQARWRQVMTVPGEFLPLVAQKPLAHAPERQRIEAADQQDAFRN